MCSIHLPEFFIFSLEFRFSLLVVLLQLDDSNRLLDDSNRLLDDSNRLLDDSNRLLDDSNRLLDDSNRLLDDSNRLLDDSNCSVILVLLFCVSLCSSYSLKHSVLSLNDILFNC